MEDYTLSYICYHDQHTRYILRAVGAHVTKTADFETNTSVIMETESSLMFTRFIFIKDDFFFWIGKDFEFVEVNISDW